MRTYLKNFLAGRRLRGNDMVPRGLGKADVMLSELVSQNKIPGMAVTACKEGGVFFQKGYGYADLSTKVPVDPGRTIFRVGSVSKPIAATALAKMVEEGMIALDASFYDYVPYYPKKEFDFTIRQLAGHMAGIRTYKGKEYGNNEPLTIREGIRIFKDDPLCFEPGTDYLYNSYDWVLISLAMQEASGIPFEEYVKRQVLDPLGMSHTFPEHPGAPISCLSHFYSKNRGNGFRRAIPVDNRYKLAGGGYLSTSGDIARLGQAYLDQKIADSAVISPFLRSHSFKGKPTWYGLGWEVSEDKKGRPYYGHVGNGVGGYANFFVYPKEQMVISLIINCTNPMVQAELDEVIDHLILRGLTSTITQ